MTVPPPAHLVRLSAVARDSTETVNVDYLARLCGSNWELWRTVTMDLEQVIGLMSACAVLTEADRSDVTHEIQALRAPLDAQLKALVWQLRARIGDRVRWYRDVEKVAR